MLKLFSELGDDNIIDEYVNCVPIPPRSICYHLALINDLKYLEICLTKLI